MKFRIFLLFVLLCLSSSCRKSLPKSDPKEKGTLVINMQVNGQVVQQMQSGEQLAGLSKALGTAPQPSELTLEILDGETSVEKFSPIGNSNKEISLSAGEYKVKAYSAEFTAPAFDKPVYADETQVSITSGGTASAALECIQSNVGVKIEYSAEFKQAHSSYSTEITQNGLKLAYTGVDETRTGYFLPGKATLTLTVAGVSHQQEITLLPQRVYTVKIKDEELPSGSIGVDLSINSGYTEEEVQISFPTDPSLPQPPGENRQLLYSENFGTKATSETSVTLYDGWENTSVSYTGSLMVTRPGSLSSLYPDASGGSCLLYPTLKRTFTVTGINTSGATSLVLTFGLSSTSGSAPTASDLEVSVSNGLLDSPLTMTVTPYGTWSLATASSGIPAATSLTLNIKALPTNILIDDIRITGVK